jgi:VWFA-related protein
MANQAQRRGFGVRTQSLACRLTFAAMVGLAAALGQNPSTPEITSHETEPSFRFEVQRNLVLVRVVVRDSRGQPVGTLRKEDFLLFDGGKRQTISQFTLEGPEAKPEASKTAATPEQAGDEADAKLLASTARRFVALYYDDVHTRFEDVVRTRDAAERYLASSLQPSDRVGVFTSSGQVVQDFTDNRDKLREALARLRPRPVVPRETDPCPDISAYQAHLMVDQNDPFAIEMATQNVIECLCHGDARHCPGPQQYAMAAATRVLSSDETQSEYSLRGLEALVRLIAVSPGQRNIVLISPGFYSESLHYHIGEIIERALHAGVIVNALDSQGLVALVPGGDATVRGSLPIGRADLLALKVNYDTTSLQADQDVMAQFAADTGGVFFHNNNDYDAGFRKVVAAPGVYYLLAFSPDNLKFDGKFHKIRVQLASARGLNLQARRGYYAPKKALDPQQRAEEDIKEAAFSQETLEEVPLGIRTQFFKISEAEAELSVLAHLDLHALRFRKDAERNLEDLTFVSVVFDRDGNFVDGKEEHVALKLRGTTLEKLMQTGITIKTDFKVKPGTYVVREVVRDGEEGHISGVSRPVEIPF